MNNMSPAGREEVHGQDGCIWVSPRSAWRLPGFNTQGERERERVVSLTRPSFSATIRRDLFIRGRQIDARGSYGMLRAAGRNATYTARRDYRRNNSRARDS